MVDYISITEVLILAAQAVGVSFNQIPRKKIMFSAKKVNGDTVALCSPQSKYHPQGFYWVDITEEQSSVMDAYDNGILFFRLEGRRLLVLKWGDIKPYLARDCMRYNAKEQNHWKLNIYEDHVKISGNPSELRAVVQHYVE